MPEMIRDAFEAAGYPVFTRKIRGNGRERVDRTKEK
jgi:hypothetical protein